jgi:hypothetical protein
MGNSYKIVGVIALAAIAACSTDTTSPDLKSPTLARADAKSAPTHNVVVTESDITRLEEDTPPTDNWVFYYRFLPTSTGAFVTGPDDPPLGVGSFEMGTVTPADKGTLFNYDHVGTRLADITAISYATYRDPSSLATSPPYQLPSINFEIDPDGPGPLGYTSLVYEPLYTYGASSIQTGVWQPWNAILGKWWATRPINGCATTCYQSWSTIVENNPKAVILSGFGVNQGSGSGGLVAATDALAIGYNGSTWIYNFEPFRSKKDCKKDGRNDAKGDDGSSSRDDGKCKKDKKDKNENSDED